MDKTNTVVAVYGTHPQAEEALRAFKNSGFDMNKLSILGKDYHTEEHVIGFYNAGDRMKFWGKRGAFWGGLCAMLFGSALFLIPGFGHIMVLGPLAGWIAGAAGEAAVVGGLSALGAGLYSIGIPKDSLPLLRLTVETGYAYARLVRDDAPSDWTLHRLQLGGRVGLGELLVPFVFAHGGYGWRATHDDSYGGGGFAYDAGLGLDLNLGVVALGLHGGYNHIDAQPVQPQWVSLGLDAAVIF